MPSNIKFPKGKHCTISDGKNNCWYLLISTAEAGPVFSLIQIGVSNYFRDVKEGADFFLFLNFRDIFPFTSHWKFSRVVGVFYNESGGRIFLLLSEVGPAGRIIWVFPSSLCTSSNSDSILQVTMPNCLSWCGTLNPFLVIGCFRGATILMLCKHIIPQLM